MKTMKNHNCERCNMTLASRQSLWNHRQHCKVDATRDFSFSNEPTTGQKQPENVVENILNNAAKRAEIVNKTAMTHAVAVPNRSIPSSDQGQKHFESKEVEPKLESSISMNQPESDSEYELDSVKDESSDSETDDDFISSDLEELKQTCRNLYNQLPHSIGKINKFAMILDELEMRDFLTKEECNAVKEHIQKQIDLHADDIEFIPDEPEELTEAFLNLCKKLHRNIEVYNKMLLVLDKMEKINCVTKAECDSIKEELQKKMRDEQTPSG